MKIPLIACVLALLSSAVLAIEPPQTPDPDALQIMPEPALVPGSPEHLLSWLGGEWDNHEQVWQQLEAAGGTASGKPDVPIPHVHQLFAPVFAPALGAHVYYVQQGQVDAPKTMRQRIYRFSSSEAGILLEMYAVPDEEKFQNAHLNPQLFGKLKVNQLKRAPGCDVTWRFDRAQNLYLGSMQANACVDPPGQSAGVAAQHTLRLSAEHLGINDASGARSTLGFNNRKVRYFSAWAYINRAGKEAGRRDTKFSSQRDLLLHNEGQRIALQYDNGSPTGYLIELSRLTYQNTKTPILKLAVIEAATGTSITYVWADPDATRIGMNLGWLQLGLTLKEQDSAFGFSRSSPQPMAK